MLHSSSVLTHTRVISFDILRGFCLISMIGFHTCFDIQGLFGWAIPWFSGVFQDVWRAQIAWIFLLLAGLMCSYTTHPLKRTGSYALCAAIIWIISSSDIVGMPISYGIIFCMTLSSFLVFVINKLVGFPRGIMWVSLFCILFILCLPVQQGYVGLMFSQKLSFTCAIPSSWYTRPFSAALGFPPTTFSSWDYYPLIPFSFLFFAGASLGDIAREHIEPSGLESWLCAHKDVFPIRILNYLGKHSLVVYMLHQPILLGLLTLIQLSMNV